MQQTSQKAEAGKIGARQLANVAYGATCGSSAELLDMLVATLSRAAEHRVSEFNAQDVANTAWAFATVKRPDEKLFAALARAADWPVSEFKMQELANTAWAYAIANQPDEKLFMSLASVARLRVCEFKV